MKKTTFAFLAISLVAPSLAMAATFDIDISPNGGALNLGSTTYTQDHAVGLSALNENAQPASLGTGNEVGSGISYDDVTNVLSFDFAYGSAFGFVDLASDWSGGLHFHLPGGVNFPAVNTNAPAVIGLAGFHTASGTRSGRVTGSALLTAGQESDLFDNLIYINIHSVGDPGGEIRGQVIAVPEPATAALALMGLLLGLAIFGRGRRHAD